MQIYARKLGGQELFRTFVAQTEGTDRRTGGGKPQGEMLKSPPPFFIRE